MGRTVIRQETPWPDGRVPKSVPMGKVQLTCGHFVSNESKKEDFKVRGRTYTGRRCRECEAEPPVNRAKTPSPKQVDAFAGHDAGVRQCPVATANDGRCVLPKGHESWHRSTTGMFPDIENPNWPKTVGPVEVIS